jgi:hypothetical protein
MNKENLAGGWESQTCTKTESDLCRQLECESSAPPNNWHWQNETFEDHSKKI